MWRWEHHRRALHEKRCRGKSKGVYKDRREGAGIPHVKEMEGIQLDMDKAATRETTVDYHVSGVL